MKTYLASGKYKEYTEGNVGVELGVWGSKTLRYAICDVNADGVPELILDACEIGSGVWGNNWVFTLDGKNVVFAGAVYGYSSLSYSPKAKLLSGRYEVKPNIADTTVVEFFRIDSGRFVKAFRLYRRMISGNYKYYFDKNEITKVRFDEYVSGYLYFDFDKVESLKGYVFSDIQSGEWYAAACLWCNEKGYMSGTGEGAFSPNTVLTRAQFVQILAKVAGVELDSVEYRSEFTDVPSGQWYSKAVTWAVDLGVTGGMGDGIFAPNVQVTRAQLAVFLRTYAQKKGISTEEKSDISGYDDHAAVPAWAEDALGWAVNAGLISGTDKTHLSPNNVATRAQAALIIKNFCENNA